MHTETAQQLRLTMTGTIDEPGDAGYEAARRVWNGVADRHPALVAHCATADDVARCVTAAREEGLEIAVRGGGHGVAGLATVEGGMVIDVRGIAGIEIDADARIARVGGGATWGEVDAATQPFGLAVPGGVFSRTGVAGLTLGGGYGWIRNRYGLSCANLRAAELVTADGVVRRVDRDHHPELLWALRGGGGNVGVVTRFEFDLHEVGLEVFHAFVFHDASADGGVALLRAFRDFCADCPDTVSPLVALGRVPEGALGFDPSTFGTPFVGFAGVYLGPPEEGVRVLEPLLRAGTPLADASRIVPFSVAQGGFDEEFPDGARYYWKSRNLPVLDDDAITRIVEATVRAPSDASTVDLWFNAGAAVAEIDGAMPVNTSPWLVNLEANWAHPADDDANISWVRDAIDALGPHSDGTGYLNFAGQFEEGTRLVQTVFGDKYRRLAEIKAQWDPDNVFHLNPNVAPALVAGG